jgi:hypothetical protein
VHGRFVDVTDCGAEVAWEPVPAAAAYALQLAAAPPHRHLTAARRDEGRGRGEGDAGDDGGPEGFRTVYRGPECRFTIRGLVPARRYRVRVRAEAVAGGGDGERAGSRWSFPEAAATTRSALPMR